MDRVGKSLEIVPTVAKKSISHSAKPVKLTPIAAKSIKIAKHPLLRATLNFRRKIFYFPYLQPVMTPLIWKIQASKIGYMMRFAFFNYCFLEEPREL